MDADDLVTLNEEIAGMAKAGLPLDQGLAALAREMTAGRLQRATARIAADLQRGKTLPEALADPSSKVPPFYAGLVQAGIRSGRLAEVLATLTTYARTVSEVRQTVVNSLFYPCVVLLLALALFGAVVAFILPRFEEIFNDFDLRLPALTSWALSLGKHPIEYLVVPVVLIVAALVGCKLLLSFTQAGRCAWARFVYGIPVLGTLVRSARLAAFSELLGILVDHQLPMPDAFALAGAASSDPIMSTAAQQVQQDLSEGMPLGAVLRSRQLVPELIAWMTAWGEQQGTLGKTLHEVAGVYRRQAEMRAALLRQVLPPFTVIATAGAIAALFIFCTILPMVKVLEALSKS
jgi:type II secretory pathway component PulF